MLAHWDDVEPWRRDQGHLRGVWRDLGRAAGSETVGLKRIQVEPGGWSTPAHVHGREEEIFYVLGGSGLSWQDGRTYEVAAGDCLVHLANREAHTLHAGDEGLDVLAFGERAGDEAAYLPRAGVLWLAHHYVLAGPADRWPWQFEEDAGPPPLPAEPSPRPPSIVNAADVAPDDASGDPAGYEGEWRRAAAAAGSRRTGLNHIRLEPGALSCPHHCHGAEEELFVILDGGGTLELIPAPRGDEPEQQVVPVRVGHVVSRPAGTRTAHAFRAGPDGLTLLAYGTRDPNDVAYYPRSNKVYLRGVGLMTRVEPLDYWDGESEEAERTPLP